MLPNPQIHAAVKSRDTNFISITKFHELRFYIKTQFWFLFSELKLELHIVVNLKYKIMKA